MKLPKFDLFCPKCNSKQIRVREVRPKVEALPPESMDQWARMGVVWNPPSFVPMMLLEAKCVKCGYSVRKTWPLEMKKV